MYPADDRIHVDLSIWSVYARGLGRTDPLVSIATSLSKPYPAAQDSTRISPFVYTVLGFVVSF